MAEHEQKYDGSDVQAQDPGESHRDEVYAGLWPVEGGTTTGEVETKKAGRKNKNQTAKKPKLPIL